MVDDHADERVPVGYQDARITLITHFYLPGSFPRSALHVVVADPSQPNDSVNERMVQRAY